MASTGHPLLGDDVYGPGFRTKAALLGEPSPLAAPFELAPAHETGNWQRMHDLAQQMYLDEAEVSAAYWRAIAWAKDACQA